MFVVPEYIAHVKIQEESTNDKDNIFTSKFVQKDDLVYINNFPVKNSDVSLPSSHTQLCDPVYTKLSSLSPII